MYTQAQFDSALLNLLVKMRNQGKEYVTVISKDLHDLVVNETSCNRCLLYTSPSPRDRTRSRMPSSA